MGQSEIWMLRKHPPPPPASPPIVNDIGNALLYHVFSILVIFFRIQDVKIFTRHYLLIKGQ